MNEPVTIIGADTVVSGNLEGDEDLTIEGQVEGSISLSRTLSIEVGGVVRADINVRNAIISGVLVGNIEAQESVHLTEQGRVVGDISAPRVILVDGASFKGNIDMGDFDVEPAPSVATTARTAPSPVHTHTHREPAQEEVKTPAPAPTRTIPVRSERRESPAPARQQRPTPSKETARRPVPVKKKAKKQPPAPKVRSVGKKKAQKKS